MDKALLAITAPAIASTAGAARGLASAAAQPFAALLQAASRLLATEPSSPEPAALEQTARYAQLAADLESRIRAVIETTAIRFQGPLGLRLSPLDGRIELADPHPQAALLEAALNENAQLVAAFGKFAALAEDFGGDPHAVIDFELGDAGSELVEPRGTR